jgi:hypothetical protein
MVNHTYGKFKPSFIDDHTLYIYLGAYSQTEIRNTSTARIQRERRAKIKSLSYKGIHTLAQSDMKFQLEYHPFVVIKYWLLNIQQNAISGCNLIDLLKKEKNEKNSYKEVYDYYISMPNLIKHKKYTPAISDAIKKSMKNLSITTEDCKTLIKKHSDLVELNSGGKYDIEVRPIEVFFGQKLYKGGGLICSEYLEGGTKSNNLNKKHNTKITKSEYGAGTFIVMNDD